MSDRASASVRKGLAPAAIPLSLALIALALVAFFDLQSNLVVVDEYARRWTIQHLVDGHGLALWGFNPNFVEMAVALPAALLHLEPRFWRLAGLPFVAMGGVFAYLIAARLGADRFWAAMAGAIVICTPIGLSLATGMMTETAFVGLLLAATWFSLRWIGEGKAIGWTILLTLLCTLQREQGVGIVGVVTVGLLLARSRRPITRRDLVGLGGLWFVVLAAFVGSDAIRQLNPHPPGPSETNTTNLFPPLVALAALPTMAGLYLMPFAVSLIGRPQAETRLRGRIELLPMILAVIGITVAVTGAVLYSRQIYVGDIFGVWGLGQLISPGRKPDLFPLPVFYGIEVATLLTLWVLMIRRRRMWRPSVLGLDGTVLVLVAASQFTVILFHSDVLDRYFLPVMVPVVPLLAAVATRPPTVRWARAAAVMIVSSGLILYVIGEQDFQAWHLARHRVAQAVYAQYPANEVNGGFEEIAVHLWIPAMDGLSPISQAFVNPHPKVSLEFARQDDPRPGVSYQSVAPGRIVIAVRDSGSR